MILTRLVVLSILGSIAWAETPTAKPLPIFSQIDEMLDRLPEDRRHVRSLTDCGADLLEQCSRQLLTLMCLYRHDHSFPGYVP